MPDATSPLRLYLDDPASTRDELVRGFHRLRDDPQTRRSHYLEGRYENVYVDRGRLPALDALLTRLTRLAAGHLGLPPADLGVGYWFNEMRPGERTLPHAHDELDELLSAVCYLRAPDGCGDLLLGTAAQRRRIRPEPGLCVFFAPGLVHEVEPNRSAANRLSLAMNFGRRS